MNNDFTNYYYNYIGASGNYPVIDYIDNASNILDNKINTINIKFSSNLESNLDILTSNTYHISKNNPNTLIGYNSNDYIQYGAIHTNIYIDPHQNSKLIFRPRYNNQSTPHKTEIRYDGRLYVYLDGNLLPPISAGWYGVGAELQSIFIKNTEQDIILSGIQTEVLGIQTEIVVINTKLSALTILDTANGTYTTISTQLNNFALWQYVVGSIVASLGVVALYSIASANRAENLANMINASYISSNALNELMRNTIITQAEKDTLSNQIQDFRTSNKFLIASNFYELGINQGFINCNIITTQFIPSLKSNKIMLGNITTPNVSYQMEMTGDLNLNMLYINSTSLTSLLNEKQGNLTFNNPLLNTTNTISLKKDATLILDGSGNLSVASATASKWTTSGNNIYNNNSGFVGIGTNNPQEKLHIHSSTASTASYIRFTNAQSGIASTDGVYMGLDDLNPYTFTINSRTATGRIQMRTGDTTRATLKSNGCFGLGITDPKQLLSVAGKIESTNGNNDKIYFSYDDANGYRHRINTQHDNGSGDANYIQFYNWTNTQGATDLGNKSVAIFHNKFTKFDGNRYFWINDRITNAGNKTYTDTPLCVFNLTPSSSTTLNDPQRVLALSREGTNGQTNGQTATFKLSRWENSSTNSRTRLDLDLSDNTNDDVNIMTMRSDGKIGVGVKTPSGTLQIGSSLLADTSDGSLVIAKSNGSTGNRQIKLGWDENFFFNIGDFGNNNNSSGTWAKNYSFGYASPNYSLRILNNGNVGLGYQTPTQKLSVNGAGEFATANGNKLIFSYTNNDYKHRIYTQHNGSADTGNHFDFYTWRQGQGVNDDGDRHCLRLSATHTHFPSSTNKYFWINNRINHWGNNDYTSTPFTIFNQTASSSTVLNDPQRVLALVREGTGGQSYGQTATFKLSRWENSSVNSRTRLDLDLSDNANDDFNIARFYSDGTFQTKQITALSTNSLNIWGGTNGNLTFSTGNPAGEVMRINYAGNVGINTTAPRTKLDIYSGSLTLRASGEGGSTYLYMATPNDTNNDALKCALICEGLSTYSRSKFHIALDKNANNSTTYNASLTNGVQFTLKYNGYGAFGNRNPFEDGTAPANYQFIHFGNSTIANVCDYNVVIHKSNGGGGTRHFAIGYDDSFFETIGDLGGNNTASYWYSHLSMAYGAPDYALQIFSNGNANLYGTLYQGSDIKIKKNIKTIDNAIWKVQQLRGVYYTHIIEGTKNIGLIAQEVEAVIPEVVNYDSRGDMKGVSYPNLVALLINAVKEQQEQINNLINRIELLESKNAV